MNEVANNNASSAEIFNLLMQAVWESAPGQELYDRCHDALAVARLFAKSVEVFAPDMAQVYFQDGSSVNIELVNGVGSSVEC